MSNLAASIPEPAGYCAGCGYDLRGITSQRCPECGLTISTIVSTIPWEHRRQIGRVRAFFRTVMLATFHPTKMAQCVAGPVDYRSAERFRWVVTILASLPFIAWLLFVVWYKGGRGFLAADNLLGLNRIQSITLGPLWELRTIWSAGATLLPVLPIGILLTVFLGTGVASNFFRPFQLSMVQQNRAVAVSRYACAPLAWLPLPAGALAIAAVGDTWQTYPLLWLFLASNLVLWLTLLLIVWTSWWNPLRLLSRTTHCGPGRPIFTAVMLPIGWILSATVGLVVFPCLVGFVWIMIDSLR